MRIGLPSIRVIVPSKFSICYNVVGSLNNADIVIVPSKFSICYNVENKPESVPSVIVPSKFSICYNIKLLYNTTIKL